MACSEQPIFTGNVGTIFRVTITECVNDIDAVVDVSTATTMEFIFKKPDGTTFTRTAVHTTDGTDGKIEYAVIGGDLDVAGVWSLQAKVIIGGATYYSSVVTFDVEESF